jgi:C1A family cysteine protease
MMKSAIFAVLMTLACANIHDRAYYEEKFFEWLKENKDIVATSGEHFVHMLTNFADNDDKIVAHNAKNLSWTMGHNKFSHLSADEWRQYVKLGLNPASEPAPEVHAAPADMSAVPTSVDWVSAGAVTGVKDQGQCGSCWSFSTTGALEGAYQIKNHNLVSFSEQNLVDCDTRTGNPKGTDMGCNGGLMDSAFSWTQKNGGLCTESAYPYTSGKSQKAGTCAQSSCTKNGNVAPKSYSDVTPNSDSAMMSALAIGPVSVAIEADQASFQSYKSGVLTAKCGTNLDHGVLAVGYGHDSASNLDYYKVKNSWGTSWGESGYIRLVRGGSTQKAGQCGILAQASYPKL